MRKALRPIHRRRDRERSGLTPSETERRRLGTMTCAAPLPATHWFRYVERPSGPQPQRRREPLTPSNEPFRANEENGNLVRCKLEHLDVVVQLSLPALHGLLDLQSLARPGSIGTIGSGQPTLEKWRSLRSDSRELAYERRVEDRFDRSPDVWRQRDADSARTPERATAVCGISAGAGAATK